MIKDICGCMRACTHLYTCIHCSVSVSCLYQYLSGTVRVWFVTTGILVLAGTGTASSTYYSVCSIDDDQPAT